MPALLASVPVLRIAITLLMAAAVVETGGDVTFGQTNGSEAPSMENLVTGRAEIRHRKFHVILVFDTLHPNHRGSRANLQLVLEIVNQFGRNLIVEARNERLSLPDDFTIATNLIALTDKDVTEAGINLAIEELRRPSGKRRDVSKRIEPGDVVFFWSETEGSNTGNGDELVLISGDRISREKLRRQLEFPDVNGIRTTALTVFITDQCRTVSRTPVAVPENAGTTSGIWRALYFGHVGTVDLSSSQPGMSSFANGGVSFFATAFNRSFIESTKPGQGELLRDRLDRNGRFPGVVEWDLEFLPELQAQTEKVFDDELKRVRTNGDLASVKLFEDAMKANSNVGQKPVLNIPPRFKVQQ